MIIIRGVGRTVEKGNASTRFSWQALQRLSNVTGLGTFSPVIRAAKHAVAWGFSKPAGS